MVTDQKLILGMKK